MRFVSHRVDTTRNSKIACVKLHAINRMKKRIVWTQPNTNIFISGILNAFGASS